MKSVAARSPLSICKAASVDDRTAQAPPQPHLDKLDFEIAIKHRRRKEPFSLKMGK